MTVTKRLSKLYKANYSVTEQNIQKDIQRWTTIPLDFSSRIQVVKMNIVPRLYLFQSLPVMILQNKSTIRDKIISRFIWNGRKPSTTYTSLQLPNAKGGMSLTNLQRPLACWCISDYEARWKDIEIKLQKLQIPVLVGNKEQIGTIKVMYHPGFKQWKESNHCSMYCTQRWEMYELPRTKGEI